MRWQVLNKNTLHNDKELLKILLSNRGLKTKKQINDFLKPKDPLKLSCKDVGINQVKLNKAIKLINDAIKKQEQIVVYGDYDCDGISATAIMWQTLHSIGAKVLPFIPDRVEEGYGLSVIGLNNLKTKIPDTKLIITVDHGIVAVEQTAYAKKLGIKVIITDHHTVGKKIPQADAIIHTTSLSGAGISWFVANTIKQKHKTTIDHRPSTIDQLDLAALGTIADMVPLTAANRTLAKFGLVEINKTKRPGLLALIKEAGLVNGSIGPYEIGYILAPRINALGRIDNALDSLRLLCTKDTEKAEKLAQRLNRINKERQKLTEETTLHAKESSKLKVQSSKLIFVSNEMYNQGIIGLVAGKLVEEYYRPAIVVSKGEKFSKASARSISGFNIIEAIRNFSEIISEAGGHPMAAGFTIETSKLELLEQKLSEYTDKNLRDEDLIKSLKIDGQLPLENIDIKTHATIEQFQPFGMTNFEPVFWTEAEVVEVRLVGNEGRHMKLSIISSSKLKAQSSKFMNAIAFNYEKYAKMLHVGDRIKIAFTLAKDEWNGERRLQLKVRDIIFLTPPGLA